MAEQALRKAVQLAASRLGARLFRNNVGTGWVGKALSTQVTRFGMSVYLETARPIHFGLCEGSSDTIGWTPVQITPEMVGSTVAVFTAIEFKTGRQTTTVEQAAFLAAVSRAGGLAGVARTVAEAEAICGRSQEASPKGKR